MSKHTPGPWSVRYDFVVQAQSFSDGRLVPVAQPYGVNTDGTDLFANARLISAAPELLEALARLEFAAQCRDNTMGDPSRLIQVKAELASAARQARDAIAKATGEQK